MAFITLITDWYNNDYYLGALKGKILNLYPDARIIDITHQVPSFSYTQAAFILKNSYRHFPPGSVHIVGINSETSAEKPFVAIKHEDHFFVGTDNGIFGLIFNGLNFKAIKLEKPMFSTFPEFDTFAETAVALAKGYSFEKLGPTYNNLMMHAPLLPTIDSAIINGSVIYIDSFGNAITNISKEVFERVGKGRRFEILVQSNYNKIKLINKTYSDSPDGELLAVFNSIETLEIAINKGNAAQLLNLSNNSVVRIKFFDKPEREDLKLN